jgi:23S rRNA (guanosine2251-2'-O)-methyltransferase
MEKLSMEQLGRMSAGEFKAAAKMPVTIVLDNVRSMHNVGSVFRTADAFLAEQIILCGFTPQPPHRDIQKTALGATETVSWSYFENAVDAVKDLLNKGYSVYAIEQVKQSIMLNKYEWNVADKIAIIFGNEVEGVSAELLPYCKAALEIPQLGTKHSLNISVSAGIVLWHLVRNYV